MPPPRPLFIPAPPPDASSSVWDRITTWASENKAVVYTIAGVTVVATAAGAYYYYAGPGGQLAPREETATAKKKAKKAKRKAEKEAEEAAQSSEKGAVGQRHNMTLDCARH